MFKRRTVLGFIGSNAVISVVGCIGGQSAISKPANASTPTPAIAGCVVRPEQTEGPYFTDAKLNRTDIRSDPTDGSVKAGLPLQLVLQISQVRNGTCTPLREAMVDVWHCDAKGVYSDVHDSEFNTSGKKFLRGYQVTDANGLVQFTTIYPGWYAGRAIHIHFKIRTLVASGQRHEFTSQLYFDDAITDQVYRRSPYTAAKQRTRNHQDSIFRDGGEQLMLQLTQSATGYMGRFALGLELV